MKQKLTALLLVLLLAVTLVLPVMAAETYVDDEAAILTLSEVETLEARRDLGALRRRRVHLHSR